MIFVVIPALNEAENLRALLPHLAALPRIARVCVVDGGSADDSLLIARETGALAVDGKAAGTPRNRGAQMNAGVAALECERPLQPHDVLWFLHADARPTATNARMLERAARDARTAGGNFALRFDHPSGTARGFELLARVLRACGMYYGDSGIWVRTGSFRVLAGYRNWPLFEDYDLARRLEAYARRTNRRTQSLRPPLLVSARRWQENPLRWLGAWARLQVWFWLGMAPEALARRYHK